MARRQGVALARELCLVYVLLITYATLHPFTGWHGTGLSPFAWLDSWPTRVLPFDLGLNVAAYVPLGLLIVWATYPGLRIAGAGLLAVAAGLALSCALESLQSYLPSRTPSLADLAANGAGALLGALLGAVMIVWFGGGRLIAMGRRWFDAAPGSTRALILAALWLSGLLFPESILFGHGSVLAYVGPVSGYPFTPAEFVRVETAVTAASLFAAGSLGLCALRPSAPRLLLIVVFCVGACAVRALSQAILFPPEHAWAWLTPGALRGLGAGVVGLMLTVALPRPMRLALIAITVTFATVVVNLAPPNPYYLSTVQVLNPGRFLNFNGLTQLVSAAWPFLVVLYIPFALVGGQREA